MDLQTFRNLLEGEQPQPSQISIKIYPLTVEILKEGERLFMERLEERLKELDVKKRKEADDSGN